jgi:Immunoglobulin I-set domain
MFLINSSERTRITDAPEDYEVAAGMTATFRCNAVSDPSLKLTIGWLNNGQQIDFEAEPRFVISTDYSLTITKTNELDSGTYTCVAGSELDSKKPVLPLLFKVCFFLWMICSLNDHNLLLRRRSEPSKAEGNHLP